MGFEQHSAAARPGAPRRAARLYVWRRGLDASNQRCGPAQAITDALHALLVQRADALDGCPERCAAEFELVAITDAIEAYEAKRWPADKERVVRWEDLTRP